MRALVKQAAPGSPVYVRLADEFLNDLAKLTVEGRRSRSRRTTR